MYITSKYPCIYAILHVYLTKTYKSSYFIAKSNCYLHQKKKKKKKQSLTSLFIAMTHIATLRRMAT
ncbi:hypothetical protein Hanom_Chr16g01447521 [Helianthus anomalus]